MIIDISKSLIYSLNKRLLFSDLILHSPMWQQAI